MKQCLSKYTTHTLLNDSPITPEIKYITETIQCQRQAGHKDHRHMGYNKQGLDIMWTEYHD